MITVTLRMKLDQSPLKRHFSRVWGKDQGNSASLHRLFPRGGPQKQGNRLAGLLRTKGEH